MASLRSPKAAFAARVRELLMSPSANGLGWQILSLHTRVRIPEEMPIL